MLWTSCAPASAQPLVVDEYTVSQGLPNNLVKQVVQDSRGFVWIATDGGLVRFDGVNMITFTVEDGLLSNVVKTIFEDSRGRLFAVTDLGVVEIVRSGTGIRLTKVAAGGVEPSDSLLFYPKMLYEDRARTLWVTDSRGILRLTDNGRRRYDLPESSWTQSFVRSYSLIEDDHGHLIVVSERGHIFVRHPDDDEFIELTGPEDVQSTNTALHRPDGTTWIGGNYGIRSFVLTEDHRITDWRVVSTQPFVMDIEELEDGRILLGTAADGLLVLSKEDGYSRAQRFADLSSPVVHDIAIGSEGDLYLSTDHGLAHVRRTYFEYATQFKSTAIQSTTGDPRGRICGVQAETYFCVDQSGDHAERVTMFRAASGLTALATDGTRHWAGTSNGEIYLYRGGELTSFRPRVEQAVSSMAVDASGDVWAVPYKGRTVARITVNGAIRHFGADDGITSPLNVVRYLEGAIYLGGDGERYLFKYDPAADRFVNVSLPLAVPETQRISVNDIDVAPDGRLWLASDQGILLYGSSDVRALPGNHELHAQDIRAITHDRFGHTWAGTGRGIYRITGGEVSHFSNDPGIANYTVHYRSIVIDAEQKPWIGHYEGISHWSRLPGEALVTPPPVALSLVVDDQSIDVDQPVIEMPHRSLLEADFVSLSVPGETIQYQYRTVGQDDSWSKPSYEGHFHFLKSAPGSHTVEVRAQQEGRLWSVPTEVNVVVALPWYQKWWAMGLFILASGAGFFLLWYVHDHIRTLQLRTRNERLERLVTKRTKELTDQKRALEEMNSELKAVLDRNHEFLGIAAHDLRNPLTSLIGFSELLIDGVTDMTPCDYMEKSAEILPIIHRAASTMQGVIQDLLDSQLLERTDRKLKLEDTSLSELTRMVVNLNAVASRRKSITLTFNPKDAFRARVDIRSMQRVIDNLLSNAVKYSPPGSEVKIKLSHTGGGVRISIVDQGPGLTEEDKTRVFGKLQRLSARPTGGEPSTGLGLYVAKGVTEMHGGRIGVNSVLGEGSEFWVEIPTSVLRKAA